MRKELPFFPGSIAISQLFNQLLLASARPCITNCAQRFGVFLLLVLFVSVSSGCAKNLGGIFLKTFGAVPEDNMRAHDEKVPCLRASREVYWRKHVKDE